MSDNPSSKVAELPVERLRFPRQHDRPPVEPFLMLRYQRKGQSVTRVIDAHLDPNGGGSDLTVDLYFAVG